MITRRKAVQLMGAGFGLVGLGESLRAASGQRTHFPAKAKQVIFLYLNGGLSHVDTFDPKPELAKRDGQPMPGPKVKTDRASGGLMKSPFGFKRYGQSGIAVSDIFPKVGQSIDDFLVVRSMYSESVNHLPSMLMMNTGNALRGGSRPSFGSWVTYGLGTENENLPGFVVLCPGQPTGGSRLWSASFLPTAHQGALIRNDAKTPDQLIQDLANKTYSREEQQRQLDLLSKLDASFLGRVGYDPKLESNIEAMETAFRMQTEAPGIFDLSKEPEHVRARYGEGEFGRGCLMALRLVEAGVRVVQVYYGNGQPWDSHDDILAHKHHARQSDGPIAALVADLKQRGLLDETLVIVGSEFGRTPMIQSSGRKKSAAAATTTRPATPSCSPAAASRAGKPTAPPTTSVTKRLKNRSIRTTSTPRPCTYSASTTSASPTATPAATSASPTSTATSSRTGWRSQRGPAFAGPRRTSVREPS